MEVIDSSFDDWFKNKPKVMTQEEMLSFYDEILELVKNTIGNSQVDLPLPFVDSVEFKAFTEYAAIGMAKLIILPVRVGALDENKFRFITVVYGKRINDGRQISWELIDYFNPFLPSPEIR